MKRSSGLALSSLVLCGATALSLSSRTQAQQPTPGTATPAPFAFSLPTKAPKGAIVLLLKDSKSLTDNWLKRRTKDPANGTIVDGVFTPNHSDITSRQEFGDFFLHVEFRCPEKGGGNAGIGLQGRYEVQIYNTAGAALSPTNGAAFYNQKPASVNASKKPGEWQTYDIVFRAPRFDAEGKVTEKPRATVYWNGVIAQNNNEFLGPTGINYEQYPTMAPTGPLILQGDHEVVQYRNVWVVPL
ncbi:MAG: DUF1080 domain-containing protein [Armatimonas sp.]